MIYVVFVLDPRYKIRAMGFWLIECKRETLANRIEAKVKLLLNCSIEQYNTFCVANRENSNVAQGRLNTTTTNLVNI